MHTTVPLCSEICAVCNVLFSNLHNLYSEIQVIKCNLLQIWLIEINVNPCLATNCEALREAVPEVVRESIREFWENCSGLYASFVITVVTTATSRLSISGRVVIVLIERFIRVMFAKLMSWSTFQLCTSISSVQVTWTDVTPAISLRSFVARVYDFVAELHRIDHSSIQKESCATAKNSRDATSRWRFCSRDTTRASKSHDKIAGVHRS